MYNFFFFCLYVTDIAMCICAVCGKCCKLMQITQLLLYSLCFAVRLAFVAGSLACLKQCQGIYRLKVNTCHANIYSWLTFWVCRLQAAKKSNFFFAFQFNLFAFVAWKVSIWVFLALHRLEKLFSNQCQTRLKQKMAEKKYLLTIFYFLQQQP